MVEDLMKALMDKHEGKPRIFNGELESFHGCSDQEEPKIFNGLHEGVQEENQYSLSASIEDVKMSLESVTAAGVESMKEEVAKVEEKVVAAFNDNIAAVQDKVTTIEEKLTTIEEKVDAEFDRMEDKVEKIYSQWDQKMDTGLKQLNKEILQLKSHCSFLKKTSGDHNNL